MKRLTREQKKEKAMIDIVNKMFEIAGHDVNYDDIVGVDKWYQKYTMTVAILYQKSFTFAIFYHFRIQSSEFLILIIMWIHKFFYFND